MKYLSLFDPSIFLTAIQEKPLRVFLCGPGYESAGFNLRKEIHSFLDRYPNIQITMGEELIGASPSRFKSGDLQTIELQFAHVVDFTVLLLESPGSIAELGTFCMLKSVRPRLFVMVPNRFFASESYIARGPLSLIASEHLNNIIYFNSEDYTRAVRELQMPISLFRYAKFVSPEFERQFATGLLQKNRSDEDYEAVFKPVRDKFFDVIVLISIIILEQATFPLITKLTKLSPQEIRRSLGRLFKFRSIGRVGGIYYVSEKGFEDPLLEHVNTGYVSRLKAGFFATA